MHAGCDGALRDSWDHGVAQRSVTCCPRRPCGRRSSSRKNTASTGRPRAAQIRRAVSSDGMARPFLIRFRWLCVRPARRARSCSRKLRVYRIRLSWFRMRQKGSACSFALSTDGAGLDDKQRLRSVGYSHGTILPCDHGVKETTVPAVLPYPDGEPVMTRLPATGLQVNGAPPAQRECQMG